MTPMLSGPGTIVTESANSFAEHEFAPQVTLLAPAPPTSRSLIGRFYTTSGPESFLGFSRDYGGEAASIMV